MSEVSSKKKRKYVGCGVGGKSIKRKWNTNYRRPRRGSPGMLLTCETGRERKCQREGLEILNYYLTTSDPMSSSHNSCSNNLCGEEDDNQTTSLSLEEELKILKSKKEPWKLSGFDVYETSCRGTVFVLCTLPNCKLIPSIQTDYILSKKTKRTEISKSESKLSADTSANHNENDAGDSLSKIVKSEGSSSETARSQDDSSRNPGINQESSVTTSVIDEKPPWDPISTIRTIMSDIDNDSNKAAPRSRFVTRMIPIQATCFASTEELQLTCLEVLKRYLSRNTKTFAIVFKRRNCSNLNRNLVIKIVGDTMAKLFPDCKVQLDKPDATIVIEVCGTLCGMSVVEKFEEFRKFNIMGTSQN